LESEVLENVGLGLLMIRYLHGTVGFPVPLHFA